MSAAPGTFLFGGEALPVSVVSLLSADDVNGGSVVYLSYGVILRSQEDIEVVRERYLRAQDEANLALSALLPEGVESTGEPAPVVPSDEIPEEFAAPTPE